MGRILDYIAKETQGKCFASFKCCYDHSNQLNIEYEQNEDSYINMKDYAEDNHSPKSRDMSCLFLKKVDSIFTLKINISISVRNQLTLLAA